MAPSCLCQYWGAADWCRLTCACMHRCPQVSKRNYKPSWNAFDIGVQSLCNANFSQPIRFKVFSWDKSESW